MHLIKHRYDPDILVGYEVQKASWGYLLERAAQLSIDLATEISRLPGMKYMYTIYSNELQVVKTIG